MKTKKYQEPDRIYEEETVSGTAISYAVTDDGVAHYPVDYELCSIGESHPEEMRASVKEGSKHSEIPDDKLRAELVVLFGPTVSAKGAVKLLGDLAENIERDGLAIGRDEDGGLVYEATNGKIMSR